jgi:hypothetical protein
MPTDLNLEQVTRYRQTIGSAWRHGDTNVWPVKLNAAIHLFLREFGEELLDDLEWLEGRGLALAEVARPFYNPSRLYRIIDSVIYSMRRNRYPVAAQRALVLKLLAMTKSLKHGSEFNDGGCNFVYDPSTAEAVAKSKLNQPAALSLTDSKITHRFCALMWAYTECIFFRAHDVTKEIHGPYSVQNGQKQFIVKEYLNVRPLELWPNVPLLPVSTIKVYKQYSSNVRIRIDALNHLYHEGGQLVPSLEACAVEADGKPQDVAILSQWLPTLQATIVAITSHIESIGWNDRVLKYADIFWFRKKPLSDQRGRDWRVPLHVQNAIRRGSENVRRRTPLSDEASERLAMLTI